MKSHLKKRLFTHFQEACHKLVEACRTQQILWYKVSGGRPPPAARQRGTHFAIGWAGFKNAANGKELPIDTLIDFEIGLTHQLDRLSKRSKCTNSQSSL